MANTGLQALLHAADIPAPSLSGLQKQANQVNNALIELNKKDMKMRRENIKDLNELKGLPRDAAIRVEGDGRYNQAQVSNPGDEWSQDSEDKTSWLTHI